MDNPVSSTTRRSRASGEKIIDTWVADSFSKNGVCQKCSIVIQDRYEELVGTSKTPIICPHDHDQGPPVRKRSSHDNSNKFGLDISADKQCFLGTQQNFSIRATLGRRGKLHLQSADLFDDFSPVQKERQLWQPILPDVYCGYRNFELVDVYGEELIQQNAEELSKLHPLTFGKSCVEVRSREDIDELTERDQETGLLRVGIILSGGPAPGGHNVISGLYDYLKRHFPESQLYGFLGGLDGLFDSRYRVVDDELMNRFRNQGGFDMLWSGRGRVTGTDDLEEAVRVCKSLGLQGLVIVGGDGSLSNAALLAEHFAEYNPSCSVIGVPKTIDGDLINAWIKTSFGFDTAAKTYSELIGNLCTDIVTGQSVYHFVRVMGRSASHLVLECAVQTRPNLVFIGEEVEAKQITVHQIVNELVDLIQGRKRMGKLFGIVLVPEGLIEFLPEMKILISALNKILVSKSETQASHNSTPSEVSIEEVTTALDDDVRGFWVSLPETIQEQLLFSREATGYIQVSKIATERLLKLLTENELQKRDENMDSIVLMPHYFGYEGRCAMPSNFDANYCYSLGYTAGVLLDNGKNGYISAIQHLNKSPSSWIPGGIPISRIMEVKQNSDGKTFPAVTRQLVNLEGSLFKSLCEVRELWKWDEYYRCPGPIQFDGPVADISNYTVSPPLYKEQLLFGLKDNYTKSSGLARKAGALSPLQLHRLQFRPEVPDICTELNARAVIGSQYLPKDPYTQRQILIYYPYICRDNSFHLQEVIKDVKTTPVDPGLRIGVIFLSRQAPGVINIIWGIHERLKIVNGHCFCFYGIDGLFNEKYLRITDEELEFCLNQGGMELLGRSNNHSLILSDSQEKARRTCENMLLHGLIIIGSSLAMTEATLTAEYFLAKGCRTSVIGVPASGSNNLLNNLIETNIGFDTSSKLYASLIGNVLADAASMPKYWHFVRLMGRQPSNEVLECALQTHPNVVIIAEEYGAANKTLADVVSDIADVVCERANMDKNFGSVLIPDGLLLHLPNMKALMQELAAVAWHAKRLNKLKEYQQQLGLVESYVPNSSLNRDDYSNQWVRQITPWSLALFKSLPKFIRRELILMNTGEMRFTLIETELLLSQMVQKELETRAKADKFHGKFSPVCHFFGYQGRSSMPSDFDATLAFAYGHLASICVESGLTGFCCTIRGLCGGIKHWKLGAIPLNSLLVFTAQDDIHPDLRGKQNELPIIPVAEVNLNGKAYRWMRMAVGQWQLEDRFCNPGPVQFSGTAAKFYHRTLHEEQAEYYNMLRQVQLSADILRETCTFGVDEAFLKQAYTNLHGLLALRFHTDDLMNHLRPLANIEDYSSLQNTKGSRPEVWGALNNDAIQKNTSLNYTCRKSRAESIGYGRPNTRIFKSSILTSIAYEDHSTLKNLESNNLNEETE